MRADYGAEKVQLIELENEVLREEVSRYRRKVAQLVEMLTAVTSERDRLRKEIAAKVPTTLVMRIGEMSSLSQNNKQLYEQNRHLQEMVVKLAAPRSEQPPF